MDLHDESIRERCGFIFAEHLGERLGGEIGGAQHAITSLVGLGAGCPTSHDALGDAAQILDQHDAQGDRHGPQFADRERLHVLISAEEAAQQLRLEPAVGVGHERPRDPENPRIPGQFAGRDLRKLSIVPCRQVEPDFADLLLGEMEVVDQPLARWRDGGAFVEGLHGVTIGFEKYGLIVGQAPSQRSTWASARLRAWTSRRSALNSSFRTGDVSAFVGPDGRRRNSLAFGNGFPLRPASTCAPLSN